MRLVAPLFGCLLCTACGGGGDAAVTQLPPPRIVATVVISSDTATLVPSRTVQLTASARDQTGAVIADRTINWTTSNVSVVSVSSAGSVTALSVGTASIVASSDAKADTARITVLDGAVIGSAGGTATLTGGAARVTIPAGALAVERMITVAGIVSPVVDARLAPGTAYAFGPSGTFSAPVTLQLRYNPATLPAGVTAASLRVNRLTNGSWVEIAGSVVSEATTSVSAPTSSFSDYALLGAVTSAGSDIVLSFENGVGPTCSAPGACGLGTGLSWTVPSDVYSATVELWGASGGGVLGIGLGAGKGGKTTSTVIVAPGEQYQVRLGGAGAGTTTSRNGGGGGGAGGSGFDNRLVFCTRLDVSVTPNVGVGCVGNGFAGGGATDIRRGAPIFSDFPNAGDRIAVAGGGGGDSGQGMNGGPACTLINPAAAVGTPAGGAPGGHGGGSSGAPGASGPDGKPQGVSGGYTQSSAGGGGGGSSTQGGTGGMAPRVTPQPATGVANGVAGTLGYGGKGGVEYGAGGGGGGGGWFGGGGGAPTLAECNGMYSAGGGGGSSFGPTGSVFERGVWTGAGRAVVTYRTTPSLQATALTLTVSPAGAVAANTAVTLTAVVSLKPPAVGTVVGLVRFEVDGVQVGAGPTQLSDGRAVSVPVTLGAAGFRQLRATFLGTATQSPSSANVPTTVTP